jgi:quercetin dioxygenase-like cupin family protein
MTSTTPAQSTRRSRPYHLSASEGEALWHLGALDVLKATGAETAGQLWVMEQRFRRGPAAPVHVHRHEDEAWFVLEGRFTVVVGDEVVTAQEGDFLWGPRDVPHGIAVDSPTGRLLTLATPAGFEHFFRRTGGPAGALDLPAPPEGPPTDEQLAALARAAAELGVELLGPPPEPRTAG